MLRIVLIKMTLDAITGKLLFRRQVFFASKASETACAFTVTGNSEYRRACAVTTSVTTRPRHVVTVMAFIKRLHKVTSPVDQTTLNLLYYKLHIDTYAN